jgi:hypothetical protein
MDAQPGAAIVRVQLQLDSKFSAKPTDIPVELIRDLAKLPAKK